MYEQMDIDGNWVKVDSKGKPHPKRTYLIMYKMALTKTTSTITTDDYTEVEAHISKELAKLDRINKRLVNDKVTEITVFVAPLGTVQKIETYSAIKTYKRLKRFRQN